MQERDRADKILVARGFAESREKAQALIMSGQVWSGELRIAKAGHSLLVDAPLEVRGQLHPYASRGGLKLEKALQQFAIDPSGMTCLDIGASTGGFTSCLLLAGAAKVYAVDVGYGQLAWDLRNDERVVNIERQNFRYLEPGDMASAIDLAVSDVSFISQRHILARLPEFLHETSKVIALIKPQFEAGRDKVGKNGVVRDPAVHYEVIQRLCSEGYAAGMLMLDLGWSPIKGPKGNIEFISVWCLRSGEESKFSTGAMLRIVEEAHQSLD